MLNYIKKKNPILQLLPFSFCDWCDLTHLRLLIFSENNIFFPLKTCAFNLRIVPQIVSVTVFWTKICKPDNKLLHFLPFQWHKDLNSWKILQKCFIQIWCVSPFTFDMFFTFFDSLWIWPKIKLMTRQFLDL